jgi:hypothetical protein
VRKSVQVDEVGGVLINDMFVDECGGGSSVEKGLQFVIVDESGEKK